MELLMNCKYLGAGKIYKYSKFPAIHYNISNFSFLINKLIPLFEQYPLHGIKRLDFLDFCKVAKLITEQKHLTIEGFNLIKKIKEGMNTGRK
jgi:hypothetical protein